MTRSYQRRFGRLFYLWLLGSTILMWFPSESGGAGGSAGFGVAIESAANLFHGLWFLLGAAILVRAKSLWGLPALGGVLVVSGIAFELGQVWVPGRSAGVVDTSWNLVGAALGLVFLEPKLSEALGVEGQRSGDLKLHDHECVDQENP